MTDDAHTDRLIKEIRDEVRGGFNRVESKLDHMETILMGDGAQIEGVVPRLKTVEHKVNNHAVALNGMDTRIKESIDARLGPMVIDIVKLKEDTRTFAPVLAAHKSKRKVVWEITKGVIAVVIGAGGTSILAKLADSSPPPKQVQKSQGP